MSAQDHTAITLKKLRHQGKLNGTVSDDTARELLKTPPSSLTVGGGIVTATPSPSFLLDPIRGQSSSSPIGRQASSASSPSGQLQHSSVNAGTASPSGVDFYSNSSTGGVDRPIARLVIQLEHDCAAFHATLRENTQLTKEHMQRSLLQLFEEVVRDKLPDALQRNKGPGEFNRSSAGGAGSGGIAGIRQLNQSRRPIDRGLDRRDTASDIVIPDDVRRQLNKDVGLVVDHELKRVLGAIGSDIQGIMELVNQLRGRVGKVEEDVMQREVDTNMLTEQVNSLTSQVDQLKAECAKLEELNAATNRDDDTLRKQIRRRNIALDATRVLFGKEQSRYKNRIYELETEIDSVLGRAAKNTTTTAAGGAGGKGKQVVYTSVGPLEDEEISNEISAATETALRDANVKFQEEKRQLDVQYCREKKALAQGFQLKIAERDAEILRLKEKVRNAGASSLSEHASGADDD